MKLCGYIRVSSVSGREGDSYISPSVQRDSIKGYALELDGEIGEWFTDEDFTGGDTDRPAFQEALTRIRANEFDGIVVMKVDRFARSVADGAAIIRELVDAGKVFASCQERIDPRTPEGRFTLTSFLANGELFLDQSKAAWWKAKARAVERGAAVGPTPFGYLRVKAIPTKRNQITKVDAAILVGGEPQPGTLIPDPETGPLITDLFHRAASGESLTNLAIRAQNRCPAEGRHPWTANEVRRWLTNRIYLGELHYAHLSSCGKVPALTDPDTFRAADPGAARAKRPTVALPFVGLVRCANCRNVMAGNTYGGVNHDTPIYRCGSACGNGSVMVASRVHPVILEAAKEAMKGWALAASEINMNELDGAVMASATELDAFIANLAVRAAIGEARWEIGVKQRADAHKETVREREVAIAANQFHRVDLDAPSAHDLSRFAFAAMSAVYIRRGRGAPADRIVIGWGTDDVKL